MELTDLTPEQMTPQEIPEQIREEEETRFSTARRLRPEAVMGSIAALCAVLLILMVVLCIPHMTRETATEAAVPALTETEPEVDEDPQSALHREEPVEPEPLPTIEPIIEPEANPYDRLDFQYNR